MPRRVGAAGVVGVVGLQRVGRPVGDRLFEAEDS